MRRRAVARRCHGAHHVGLIRDELTALARAAFLHELGTTAIPNSILDKPGPLTRAEFDRDNATAQRLFPAVAEIDATHPHVLQHSAQRHLKGTQIIDYQHTADPFGQIHPSAIPPSPR